jgi:hypothetical protein
MSFIKVSLGQSCILLRFPHLEPLLNQVNPRYGHTLPCCSRTTHIPKVPQLVRNLFHGWAGLQGKTGRKRFGLPKKISKGFEISSQQI